MGASVKRSVLFFLSLLPMAAVAHPDHGSGVYTLAHFLSGSHLVPLLGVALVLYAGIRIRRRRGNP